MPHRAAHGPQQADDGEQLELASARGGEDPEDGGNSLVASGKVEAVRAPREDSWARGESDGGGVGDHEAVERSRNFTPPLEHAWVSRS